MGIRACIASAVSAALLALAVLAPLPAQAKKLGELLPQLVIEHERVQAAEDRREAAYHTLEGAKAAWYPRVDLTGDVAQEDIDTTKKAQETTVLERNTQKVRATQLLTDFGLTDSIIGQNKALYDQAELNKVVARQGLILEGINAYLDVMRYSKTLAYALQAEQSIKERWEIEDSRVEKGAGLKTDELQAKAQLAGATAARVGQEGLFKNAVNRFRALYLYAPEDGEIQTFELPVFPADLVPPTEQQAVDLALKGSLTLKVLRTNVDAADEAVVMAESSFYPSFNGYGEVYRKENDAGSVSVKQEHRVGVEFAWNLFAGGGDVSTLKAARAGKSASVNDLLDNRRVVEESVRRAWVDLLTARDVSEWYHNQAVIQGEFLELARKQRDTKGTDQQILSDLLNAEVGYTSALSGAVSADVDMYLAAYRLLHAMGQLEMDLFVN